MTDRALDLAQVRQRAEELDEEGLDCAQTVVRVFLENGVVQGVDKDTMMVLATGLGNGLGAMKGNCGALLGACLVLNAVFGRYVPDTKGMYKITGQFSRQFLRRFGSLTCRELLNSSSLSCGQKTAETAVLLAQFIENELPSHAR
ncbi:MAG: C_GCAxxG_C_C family protein [bacterium]|nr:C_GCAxxG_C_C family protein [bacterium]